MKKIIAVLAFGLMLSGVASAVEIRGGPSCGKWLSDSDLTFKHGNQMWLLGYLSGISLVLEKDSLKGTDNPSIFLWMDNFCKANPLKSVADGAQDLFLELVKQKGL